MNPAPQADRGGGVGDPGALATQERDALIAAAYVPQLRLTTGDDLPLPVQDPSVLADRVDAGPR